MKMYVRIMLFLIVLTVPVFAQRHADTTHPKIGLVLSGGGALGFAHVGVLQVIDSLGIPIDQIAGTSFGALVGGLYAIGYRSDSLQTISENTDWQDLFSDTPKRNLLPYAEKKYSGRYEIVFGLKGLTPIFPSGAIAGQKISLLFSKLTCEYAHVKNLDSLPIPFRCVAVDLITGREVILTQGPLARAMRASMSIPSAFTPVTLGDSLLVDGGVLNNYPSDVLKAMGADILIGVNLSGYKFLKKNGNDIGKILDRATSISRYQKIDSLVKITDIYIEPQLEDFGITDFDASSIRQLIALGRAAADEHLAELVALKKRLVALHDTARAAPLRKNPASSTIHEIFVAGNESIDDDFVRTLLNVKKGSLFSPEYMEQQITSLYSLGYFETITYRIIEVNERELDLYIDVKEKPLRALSFGLRYDDYYQLVGLIGVRTTNFLFPGARMESELEFAGLVREWSKFSYPSRSLDRAIYPFVAFRFHRLPLDVYLPQYTVSCHDKSVSIGGGTGLTLSKSWNIEAEMDLEQSVLSSDNTLVLPEETKTLKYASVTGTLDHLDNVMLPRSGVVIRGGMEYSNSLFDSPVNYTKMYCTYDMYTTVARRHTLRFKGDWMDAYGNLPFVKNFFIGGPDQFAGANYQQITGSRFVVLRGEYRFEYKRDIFLKGIFNTISVPTSWNAFQGTLKGTQFGYGAAVLFTSIIGNLEITLARGNTSFYNTHAKQVLFHLSAGTKF